MPPSVSSTLTRTVVIGTSCSGKTTFARALAGKLGVPHIEMDALHWGPNWTPAPRDAMRERVSAAIAAPRWVLDGNYGVVRDLVWARATDLVWLDYPFPVVFSRALRRTFRRVFTREELWAGNRESFRLAFMSRDSILWWVLTTYHRRRREYPQLFAEPEYGHLRLTVLRSPAEAERFLGRAGE